MYMGTPQVENPPITNTYVSEMSLKTTVLGLLHIPADLLGSIVLIDFAQGFDGDDGWREDGRKSEKKLGHGLAERPSETPKTSASKCAERSANKN
jgi:hypothetical protein